MPKMFGMKFPLPVLSEKILYSTTAFLANTTGYLLACDQGGESYGSNNVSEAVVSVNYLVTRAGLLKNLVVRAQSAPGGGQTYIYTIRINGVPTGITCTLTEVTVNGSDLVNTAEVVIGDRVTLQLITSLGAAIDRHIATLELDSPSTRKPYEHTTFSSGTSTVPVNITRFLASLCRAPTAGGNTIYEVEVTNIYLCPRKGSLKNLVALAGSAPGLGETFVYTVRVNGVATAMTVTLSGAAQVTGTDIVNVVQVDPSDRITLRVITSLAASVATHAASFDFEEGDYRAG